ncbi:unnamed protein product, partial [Linum tenue]
TELQSLKRSSKASPFSALLPLPAGRRNRSPSPKSVQSSRRPQLATAYSQVDQLNNRSSYPLPLPDSSSCSRAQSHAVVPLVDQIMASTTSPQQENDAGGLQVHCFTDVVDELTLHFQIIRLPKQIYAWIGCNSSKMGHLYAAAHTRPSEGVSVSCVLGGSSDNPGAGIARRIVLKSGLNVILASNIPKNSPLIEVFSPSLLYRTLTKY